MTGPARCPDCGAGNVAFVWGLPAGAGLFAEHRELGQEAALYECRDCGLRFRDPCPDQATLTSLYESVPEDTWSTLAARPSWGHIRERIERLAPDASVLDIGCFTGDFLAGLPGRFSRFGVEPNPRACDIARGKGITIVGHSFEGIASRQKVGAVTMLDVVEHVQQPSRLFSVARQQLLAGGILVVLTGNSTSWPWRLVGPTYWYSAIPGHVRFLNREWARRAAARMGMELIDVTAVHSETFSWRAFLRQGAQSMAFAAAHALGRSGWGRTLRKCIPVVRRAASWTSPPWWPTAPDHAVFVFREPSGARS